MKYFLILFFLTLNLRADVTESCKSPPNESFESAKIRLTKKILEAGLRYAREHSNHDTGFVEDTVDNYDNITPSGPIRASISSTGFLMALVADLSTKKMVSRREAYQYCLRPILAVLKKKNADLNAARLRAKTKQPDPHTDITYKGWFSHFIDWQTGDRWIDQNTHRGVEYATTDSTWFFAGGIVCSETFPRSRIPILFNKIFADVDFYDFMTDGGAQPDKRTLSMSYTPEDVSIVSSKSRHEVGYSKAQWEIYQHSWLVYLLGLGAPRVENRLPLESWSAWRRTGIRLPDGQVLYGDKRALFSHYFPDVFMPPQLIKEECKIDYFSNSKLATRFNKEMSLNDLSSQTFRAGLWGLDAGPNPNFSKLKLGTPTDIGKIENTVYGVNTPYKRNGTACPACAVASVMFEPDLVLSDLRSWCDNKDFGSKFWGKYGPTNGINLDYGWISPISLSGIVGPMSLSAANLDPDTSVWKLFSKYPAVQIGLEAAELAPMPAGGCLLPE